MPNPTHSDLDNLKSQAQIAKNQKKARKFLEEGKDSVRSGDILVVLHEEEVEILTNTILDVLGGEPIHLNAEQRKLLAGVYKHIVGGNEDE